MPDDLHSRLREAIEARKALAEAAARDATSARWTAGMFRTGSLDVSDHIAANDPATVLRHCERDLKVLQRHRLVADHPEEICHWCREFRWPCVEIRDLAEAYAIPIDDQEHTYADPAVLREEATT